MKTDKKAKLKKYSAELKRMVGKGKAPMNKKAMPSRRPKKK